MINLTLIVQNFIQRYLIDGRNGNSNSPNQNRESCQKKATLNIFRCFGYGKSRTNNIVKDDNVINHTRSSSNILSSSSNPTQCFASSLDNLSTTSQLNKEEHFSHQSSYEKELVEEVLASGR